MAQRSFQVEIQNSSSWLNLVKYGDYLAHGEWTDAMAPPDSIAPGSSATLGSESAGFMTGTEGYVKYTPTGPDGGLGELYIYWDNPFYGVTKFRSVVSGGDVPPDTDPPPEGGSSFPDSPDSLPFRIARSQLGYTEAGGEFTAVGDLVHYAVGPVSLFGLVGILKDAVLRLEMVDTEPTFRDLGPQTIRPLEAAGPNDWVGDWRDGDVEIEVTSRGLNRIRIHIDEHGATPFQLDTETTVGADWLMQRVRDQSLKAALGAVASDLSADADKLLTEVAREVAVAGAGSLPSATASRFEQEATRRIVRAGNGGSYEKIGVPADAIADLFGSSTTRLVLDEGVVLELYGLYQDNARIGEHLHYQRMNHRGELLADRMLSKHFDIR